MNIGSLNRQLFGLSNCIEKNIRWWWRRFRFRKEIKAHLSKPYKLSNENKREAKKFWKKYSRHFSILWHEFYYQKTGVFNPRFIPDDIMYTEIEDYFNDRSSSYGLDNKCIYDILFPEVEQPQIICRKMKGIWHGENYDIISKEEAILRCVNCGNVVIKQATGVGFGEKICFWNKNRNSEEELHSFINLQKGDVVIQTVIKQHSELERLESKAIHCIRIITLATKEGIKYICGYFRMGQDDSLVDYVGGYVAR